MATLQDDDKLIVQRGSDLRKIEVQNMSTIQDTDLLIVGRGNDSYKITGQDFLDNVVPKSTVDQPSIIAPADNAGEMVGAESDEIVGWDASTKILTLAGDKDLTVFQPLDDVEQDSGYTPVSDSIVKVNTLSYTDTVVAKATVDGVDSDFDEITNPDNKLSNVFTDGNFSGYYIRHTGTTVRVHTYTFPTPIDFTNSLEVLCYAVENLPSAGRASLGWIDDQGVASPLTVLDIADGVIVPETTARKYKIPNLTPGTKVKSIVYKLEPLTTGGVADIMFAFYVDGKRLIDGEILTLTLASPKDLANFRVGDEVQPSVSVTAIDEDAPSITANGGTWNVGEVVTGPATTPATGTVASTDPVANTMTLSVSDETYPKRWIVNQGKFVKVEETPSQDAAPDADGLTIQSSAFASTPAGTLSHTTSDWQITLKTDTTYANPVDAATDSTDLTQWEPSGLEDDTAYRCRVRHNSGAIQSDWSEDSTFKTNKSGPNKPTKPGTLYWTTTQTTAGDAIPLMSVLPANADGTSYIDVAACSDTTPAILLDDNNSLWVVSRSYAAPIKASIPFLIGRIIKLAGGLNPGYRGNALILTDTGELWRGWDLLTGGGTWKAVLPTTLGFPPSEVVSLFSQAYCDGSGSNGRGIFIVRNDGGVIKWYVIKSSAEDLGTITQIAVDDAQHVVTSNPNTGGAFIWIKPDGTLGGTSTPTDTTSVFTKLFAAGFTASQIWGITDNNILKQVYGGSNVVTPPADETIIDCILPVGGGSTGYASRAFILCASRKVYLSANSVGADNLHTANWIEATDLAGKYSAFGTLSSQAPVLLNGFHLIVPN